MGYSYGPSVVKDGMVMCLDAANGKSFVSGSGTWFDLTANNNTGSLKNGPVFSSQNGGSLTFDGVDDYVIIGQYPYQLPTIGTNDVTINVWSNITATTSGSGNFRWFFNTGVRSYYYLGYVDGKMTSFFGNASASLSFAAYGTAVLPLNTWIMTTAVMDRSADMKLYLNGVFEPASGSTDISSSDGIYFDGFGINPVTVGAQMSNRNIPFRFHQGNIALVQLYFRTLSASEVLQNYNATKGRFGL